jgi:hypothetical protein
MKLGRHARISERAALRQIAVAAITEGDEAWFDAANGHVVRGTEDVEVEAARHAR